MIASTKLAAESAASVNVRTRGKHYTFFIEINIVEQKENYPATALQKEQGFVLPFFILNIRSNASKTKKLLIVHAGAINHAGGAMGGCFNVFV